MKYQVYKSGFEKSYPKNYELTAAEFLEDFRKEYDGSCDDLICNTDDLLTALISFEDERKLTDMSCDDKTSGTGERIYNGDFVKFIVFDEENESYEEVDALLDEMI